MGRRIRWGALAAVAATVALVFGTEVSLLHAVALPLFLILFPTAALAQTPLLRHLRFERLPAYLQSGFTILVMGGMALGLVVLGPGAEAAGIATLSPLAFAAWTAGLTVGCLLLSLAFRPLELRAWQASAEGTLADGMVDALLPRTPEERRLFAGLSLAAGWGEEMAYRGYVPAALVLAGLGPWSAMGVAAGAFGLLHAYQGPVGVVRTGVVGFLLGVSVILTGSLFPAMVAHALLDLILGLVVGPWLLKRAGAPAGSGGSGPGAGGPGGPGLG
jgi:membrane protease YdiL (CAAX protease family)